MISSKQRCRRKSVSAAIRIFKSNAARTLSILEANKEAPEAQFEVEHVYGYRASDCQQNLRYTSEGKAVYMVAALGVVMDTNTCE